MRNTASSRGSHPRCADQHCWTRIVSRGSAGSNCTCRSRSCQTPSAKSRCQCRLSLRSDEKRCTTLMAALAVECEASFQQSGPSLQQSGVSFQQRPVDLQQSATSLQQNDTPASMNGDRGFTSRPLPGRHAVRQISTSIYVPYRFADPYNPRTQRIPLSGDTVSGDNPYRRANRIDSVVPAYPPPRRLRTFPVDGPCGSSLSEVL